MRLTTMAALAVLIASVAAPAFEPVEPVVQPGYAPGPEAREDERGIWMEMAEAEAALRTSPLVLEDHPLTEYVRDVACRVAGPYCGDVRVYVLRNPTFNASMAPNGTMLVHTGLLARMASADQLAAILGHELAHFTQAHSIQGLRAAKSRMTAGMLLSLGLAVGGVAAGGLPEILAVTSVMSFSRGQEAEADTAGAKFMADAGFDPAAAAEVWQMLETEERNASVKREQGAIFLSSHPAPETRLRSLTALAASLAPATAQAEEGAPYVEQLQASYELLMDAQVKHRDFGRLTTLLDRHAAMGVRAEDVAFYRGEAWRIRAGAGDHERAAEQYRAAIAGAAPNVRAFKELGYLLYKHGDRETARAHFREYLERVPDDTDRAMIEFYLEDDW